MELSIVQNKVCENIEKYKAIFAAAKPFQYVVIDNFLKPDFFKILSSEMSQYYRENKNKGRTWNTLAEDGKWGSTGLELSPNLRLMDGFLKSKEFVEFLECLTGFKELVVTKNINGIGFSFFHAMKPGSFLAPHTDHTRDLNNGPYHVLNVILYLSESWDPNWGGATTLFDDKVNLKGTVEYRPNRALIFMHSPHSIHGTQRVSNLASFPRFTTYYDYYTNIPDPYSHLDVPDFQLINSPHLFYLEKKSRFFKKENRHYISMHITHWKASLKNRLISMLK